MLIHDNYCYLVLVIDRPVTVIIVTVIAVSFWLLVLFYWALLRVKAEWVSLFKVTTTSQTVPLLGKNVRYYLDE